MIQLWKRQWTSMTIILLSALFLFNCYILIKIRVANTHQMEAMHQNLKARHQKSTRSEFVDGDFGFIPETSVCSFRATAFIGGKKLKLNRPPFDKFTSNIRCLLNGIVAVFGQEFAVLNKAILNPSKINSTTDSLSVRGGENMEEVWDQPEDFEYVFPLPGYFTVPCEFPPLLDFDATDFKCAWAGSLRCYDYYEDDAYHTKINSENNELNSTGFKGYSYIPGLTIALTRYEYANFYHTMTEFYNAFVLKLLFSDWHENVNILFVDAHPRSNLDVVWFDLFGKVNRAGRLTNKTKFEKLVWGIQGYRSPLNRHDSITVPYLEEFRHFVLTRHGIVNNNITLSSSHVIDCRRLNVVIIWRQNHVTHPRNKKGKVVRKFSNEDEIIKTVQDALREITPFNLSNTSVTGVVLERLKMKEQLSIIATCDLLIGMHGAGLSHALFLPSSSALLELLPSYSSPDLIHFQAMAKWRNLVYLRWQNVERAMDKDESETYIRPQILRKLVKTVHGRICSGA